MEFPGIFEIAFDILREHIMERKKTTRIVDVVGIKPHFWNVAGRFSIAGPTNEFTAIDTLPSMPIVAEELSSSYILG